MEGNQELDLKQKVKEEKKILREKIKNALNSMPREMAKSESERKSTRTQFARRRLGAVKFSPFRKQSPAQGSWIFTSWTGEKIWTSRF